MVQDDLSTRLDQIMKLALLANPRASQETYKQYVFKILNEFSRLAFVAIDNDKIVGYIMGSLQEDQGEIEDLAILDEYRQRGYGRKLMDTELSAMKRSGAERAIVWVSWRNSSSIPFYYRAGFRFLRCERDRITPGETADVIYLEKYL